MKKSLLSILFILGNVILFAQNPVKWTFEAKSLGGDEYTLIATAIIEEGNYTYSQYLASDDGPVRTSFEYAKGGHYTLVGKNQESGDKVELDDPLFDNMHIIKYKHKMVCTQKVKVSDPSKPITGYVTYMSCNNESCLPPKDINFKYVIPASGGATPAPNNAVAQMPTQVIVPAQPVVIQPQQPAPIDGRTVPVKWTFETNKINDKEYDLIFKGQIDKKWYIYSQIQDGTDGPNPTTFEFKENKGIERVGKVEESKNRIEAYDKTFAMKVRKFKNEAIFTQRIKINDASAPIEGYLTYQACDDARCLPPTDVPFKFDFSGSVTENNTPSAPTEPTMLCPPDDPNCQGVFSSKRDINKESFIRADCGTVAITADDSLWKVFLLAFLGGLFALLTPCVFPMIPLTVSLFTKTATSRSEGITKAIIYGISIIVIYVFIGLVVTAAFGPNILNQMATNPWVNLAFFLIFIAFSLSFFGFFEITLPSSWTNAADKGADKGGLIGIFFMAFTLALVSFSCTGPIIGSLLVQTAQNVSQTLFGFIPIKPLVGMFGFSLALALPFALFAMFPSWLNSLPKSGGWMEGVKVTLGFVELALALKFLSTADLVAHWGYLRWELFLILWIIFSIGLGLYHLGVFGFKYGATWKDGLLGAIVVILGVAITLYFMATKKESFAGEQWRPFLGYAVISTVFIGFALWCKNLLVLKNNPFKNLSAGRWGIGLASILFAAYLSLGFGYKPLTALSGLAPSYTYNFWSSEGCVHGIECFHDFDQAVAYAKTVNKPVFVDFTGYGCVNCRKMEENVWIKPEILKYLKDEYVVASLYVDDEERLYPNDKMHYQLDTKDGNNLRTVGSKWASFQNTNFGVSSQPYYILMDNDGKTLLTRPTDYTPDVPTYENFLNCGLQAFKELEKRRKAEK